MNVVSRIAWFSSLASGLEEIVDFSAIPQAERRVPVKHSLKFPSSCLPGALVWGGR